ncbi:MFS transporter [Aeromicrobium piscarium]|uniref:MFS transporter n=1 Tax=Aeromicrobium piscarium TaxID=2590901 RepID=A0A554RVQ0_9ACTN|nr:MFS transporter [Aeromicrobium piscarium]TSD58181.1 MFS transporter [Aeromicrobium piscarium]
MQHSATPRRARAAAMVAFATNGALPATLLARYAEVKDDLGLSAAVFGIVVVGFTIGAAGAFHLPGVVLRRLGMRWTTAIGTAWIALALVVAGSGVVVGSAGIFAAGLILAGFGDAVVDVAQNAQGLRVQEVYGRSVLTSMHAGWSIGAAIGGVVGTAAASAGVPLTLHLTAWGVLCVIAMAAAARLFLPEARRASTEEAEPGPLGRHAMVLLAPLALVALAGISVEDVGNNWSAVLLSTERDVPASSAGIGLSALLIAQFIGRLLGDRFIDRVGHRAALITSLAAVAGGLTSAAWSPGAWLTLVGLALAGLGCAITVPLAFARADALPGLRPHAGVTWIGWTMRIATIALSPAIGGVATVASLPIAISAVALVAVLALGLQLRPGVR